MNYLVSYLQLGGYYLVIFFILALVDAFIVNDVNHTVHLVLKKPYEGYRDLLKILSIIVAQLVLWPFALILLVAAVFTMYSSWKDNRGFR